jgi:hypothetical protein
MKCYEFFENYYRCVYVVADLYDYTSNFMEVEARKDPDLIEAQALVWYSLRFILGIDLQFILKYGNTNTFKLYKYCNIIHKSKSYNIKTNLLTLKKEFENDTPKLYRSY